MAKEKEQDRLLTVQQTADLLAMSDKSIYTRIQKNAKSKFPIKPIRIGSTVRFRLSDVNRFIARGK